MSLIKFIWFMRISLVLSGVISISLTNTDFQNRVLLQTHEWNGWSISITTLRVRQIGHNFADDAVKCNFLNDSFRIYIQISLKFVPKGPINNIPALVQIMAWRRPGNKKLSELMMVNLLTHICVARSQWVKPIKHNFFVEIYQIKRYIIIKKTSSNGNIFRVTGHLCGEFTGHRWIHRTKASDAELWCFLWSASE